MSDDDHATRLKARHSRDRKRDRPHITDSYFPVSFLTLRNDPIIRTSRHVVIVFDQMNMPTWSYFVSCHTNDTQTIGRNAAKSFSCFSLLMSARDHVFHAPSFSLCSKPMQSINAYSHTMLMPPEIVLLKWHIIGIKFPRPIPLTQQLLDVFNALKLLLLVAHHPQRGSTGKC